MTPTPPVQTTMKTTSLPNAAGLCAGLTGLLLFCLLAAGCVFITAEQRDALDRLDEEIILTQERISLKTADTPESALNDARGALDAMLAYTAEVRADPARYDQQVLDDYGMTLRIIDENINRLSALTLRTDVSFPLGSYRLRNLSAKAKKRIDKLAADVVRSIDALSRQYPGQQLNLIVKTVGYTDETTVLPDTALYARIKEELGPEAVPADRVERRKAFNQVLSRYRAATLNRYMVEAVRALAGDEPDFTIEPVIIGRGEALPGRKVEQPYGHQDARRRMCIVSAFVEVIP